MVREETINNNKNNSNGNNMKFLCSYGGKILPRSTDGVLRYIGGLTRVLAVNRHISYSELMVKLVEFCGYSVDLRCQLPNGDLETLVSVKSDEELINLIDEYDKSSPPGTKIRAVLFPPKSLKTVSPPPSSPSSPSSTATSSPVFDPRRRRSSSPSVGFAIHPGRLNTRHRCCYRHCH